MNRTSLWIGLSFAGAMLAIALVSRAGAPSSAGTAAVERANLAFTLKDMHGQDVSLASFAGKPLVINLWATWCAPCRLETPQLVDLYARFKERGVTIVGVSADDTPEAVRSFAEEFKVDYPMLVGLNEDDFLAAMGYDGSLPMTVFIRADGTVAHRMIGIATTSAWERHLLSLF